MKCWLLVLACVACGPSNTRGDCTGADCPAESCDPGATRDCYTGDSITKDVGPCHGGTQHCTAAGQWGNCTGQVVPVGETCTDSVDNNCNGMTDEKIDADGDGYATCNDAGGSLDCCDAHECGTPTMVNPGAVEVAGDTVDNDCDGMIDNEPGFCDQGLASNTTSAADFAKAIDICQMANPTEKKWGLVEAKLTLPDGTGVPDPNSHSVRPKFGAKVLPQGGVSLAVISSGGAAAKGDINPPYRDFESYETTKTSGFPADFLAANAGSLPNAPGCPDPSGSTANDPVMLTFKIRAPTNAKSFSLRSNFFSVEFPEYTCSPYNDFFVVLIDSMSTDNPADKNLAFYTPPNSMTKVPVGVNLGHGNTGLFTQCVNGNTGCASGGQTGTISSCTGTDDLQNTGFDDPAAMICDAASLKGGATGWLTTSGNVVPGELITLRIAIWDTSDHALDSLAVIDGFKWSAEPATPGTVILRAPY
ncbi:MAG TPA: MopE-related protein [Kofleriaceae bacterium]